MASHHSRTTPTPSFMHKLGQKVQPVTCLSDFKRQPVTVSWPHTGALDHHVPDLCASTASSLVGAPLHGCSRADEALPGVVGSADAGKFHTRLSGIGAVTAVGSMGRVAVIAEVGVVGTWLSGACR
jgi:hypothetical protein